MKRITIFIAALLCAFSFPADAKVKLPSVIGDNMVLQQDTLVNIWGWAAPGARVTVSPSWGGRTSAKADASGRWTAEIRTPEASFEKRSITVSDGTPVTLENILIGEVWLCSGQSNMEMQVQGGRDCPVENSQQIIVESIRYPDIRLFSVKIDGRLHPQEDVTGAWAEASPQTVKTFSAVGYLFGKELRKSLDVPIGIINSSCGGTWIEAWFPDRLQTGFGDYDPEAKPTADGQSGMVKTELLAFPAVDEVVYQRSLVDALNANLSRISLVLGIFIVLLLFVSFVLINNTIRLNVYARRFTIHTMKLVGATRSFIRSPFMVQAVFQGIFSAMIAVLGLIGLLFFIRNEIAGLFEIFSLDLLLAVIGIVMVSGIVICLVSTCLVVNKLISLDKDDLYY